MKRSYTTPAIRLQAIDAEDFLDNSLPIFNEDNASTVESDVIGKSEEVLGNSHSVWDE
jgi:hypothetical protein